MFGGDRTPLSVQSLSKHLSDLRRSTTVDGITCIQLEGEVDSGLPLIARMDAGKYAFTNEEITEARFPMVGESKSARRNFFLIILKSSHFPGY